MSSRFRYTGLSSLIRDDGYINIAEVGRDHKNEIKTLAEYRSSPLKLKNTTRDGAATSFEHRGS